MASQEKLPGMFTLAVDEFDAVHILMEPGSRNPALCGVKPTVVWKRVWRDDSPSASQLAACARCRLLHNSARPAPTRQVRALVLDDNATDRTYVRAVLASLPGVAVEVSEFETAGAALLAARKDRFDLAIIDYHLMGKENGVDVLEQLKKMDTIGARVLLTGDGRDRVRDQALKGAAAHDVIVKTSGPRGLKAALTKLLGSSPAAA